MRVIFSLKLKRGEVSAVVGDEGPALDTVLEGPLLSAQRNTHARTHTQLFGLFCKTGAICVSHTYVCVKNDFSNEYLMPAFPMCYYRCCSKCIKKNPVTLFYFGMFFTISIIMRMPFLPAQPSVFSSP